MKYTKKSILAFSALLIIFIGAGQLAARMVNESNNTVSVKTGDYSTYGVTDLQPIVMYTLSTCGNCVEAKAYLDSKGVEYLEKEVMSSQEIASEAGRLELSGVPAIIIGERLIVGFHKKEIDEAISALSNNVSE